MARAKTSTADPTPPPPDPGAAVAVTADPTPPAGSTFIVPAGQGRKLRPRMVSPEYVAALREYSKLLYDGGLVPKASARPEGIAVLIEIGRDVGLPATMAVAWVAIINGRPSIYGDAAMALIRSSGLLASARDYYEGEGDAYAAVCELARVGAAEPRVQRFSVADAKRARLWGKPGPWTEYPERMLAFRARGFCARDEFADVLCGLIFAEEANDLPPPRVVVTTEADDAAEVMTPAAPPVVNLDAGKVPAVEPQPQAATADQAAAPVKPTRARKDAAPPAPVAESLPVVEQVAADQPLPAVEPEPAPESVTVPVSPLQLEEVLRLQGLFFDSRNIADADTDEARQKWAEYVFVNTAPRSVRSVRHLTTFDADRFIVTIGRDLDPFSYPRPAAG